MKKFNHVIIVDDDEITSFLIDVELKKNLKPEVVRKFYNAELALEFLRSEIEKQAPLPDLILLDINMPVMDGWEFLDLLSTTPKEREIPVVILSSSIDPNDVEKAKKYKKVKGFVSKPFKAEKLNDLFANAVKN